MVVVSSSLWSIDVELKVAITVEQCQYCRVLAAAFSLFFLMFSLFGVCCAEMVRHGEELLGPL